MAFSSINRHFVVNIRKKGENEMRIFFFPFHRTFELRRAGSKSAFYYSVANKREIYLSYSLFFTQQKNISKLFLSSSSEHFFECVLWSHENSSQNKSIAKKKFHERCYKNSRKNYKLEENVRQSSFDVKFILHFLLNIARVGARAHKATTVKLCCLGKKRYHEKCIYFQSAAFLKLYLERKRKTLSNRIKV